MIIPSNKSALVLSLKILLSPSVHGNYSHVYKYQPNLANLASSYVILIGNVKKHDDKAPTKEKMRLQNENDFSVAKENPIKIEHSEIAEKRIAKKCEQIEL